MVSTNIYSYISFYYNEEAAQKFSDFAEKEPVIYIRVNTIKNDTIHLKKILSERYGIETEEVTSVPDALKVIKGRELVSRTIEHIMGEFYIQGLSSMIPPIILDPQPGERILDLCAAPGSKTTQIAEYMKNRGTLVANEIQLERIKTLVYNIDRMNVVNTGIIHSKGEILSKTFNNYFDKVLVDAPCSGMGIVQKKGEVNTWWNITKSKGLGELQFKLLTAAVKMLKTGGELVYSTCTLSLEENELVINKLINKYPLELMDIELPVISHPGFTHYHEDELNPTLNKTRRILPWEADTDGFFIVKLKKIDDIEPNEPLYLKPSTWKIVKHDHKDVSSFIKNASETFGIAMEHFAPYKYLLKNLDIFLIADDWDVKFLSKFERVGTRFGIMDKNDELTFHTQSAQVFRKFITKNIYQIENAEDFKTYVEGGVIKKDIAPGQYVMEYRGNMLGTAIVTEQGIKSRFPKAKRSQALIFES